MGKDRIKKRYVVSVFVTFVIVSFVFLTWRRIIDYLDSADWIYYTLAGLVIFFILTGMFSFAKIMKRILGN